MTIETLMMIIAIGVIILILIILVCGFYLINILRNLDRIIERIDDITDITSKYVIKPLFTVSDVLKKYKLFKTFTKHFKKEKNERKINKKR